MASSFSSDLGRVVRGVPGRALALPGAVLSMPKAILRTPSKRMRRRLLVGLALAVLLAAGYMLWFRNSSLLAVDRVEITGVSFAEEEITAALTVAGQKMTTLNADAGALERAVEGFPTVSAVTIDPDFPHGLAVTVTERAPVGTVGSGGGVAVAGDGTVLNGVRAGETKLPTIELEGPPSSGRLDGVALAQAEVLGAAPAALIGAIEGTEASGRSGLTVNLVGEIELRFGDSANAAAKWAAAVAILADPKLETVTYIDLRIPGRPAVGGAPIPQSTADDAAAAAAAAPVVSAPVDPVAAPVDPALAPTEPALAPATADPAATAPAPAPPAPVPAPATGLAGGAPAP